MDKKEMIFAAALKLFVKNGIDRTPTAMISKEAGVATGTLFHYFSSKEVLVNELYPLQGWNGGEPAGRSVGGAGLSGQVSPDVHQPAALGDRAAGCDGIFSAGGFFSSHYGRDAEQGMLRFDFLREFIEEGLPVILSSRSMPTTSTISYSGSSGPTWNTCKANRTCLKPEKAFCYLWTGTASFDELPGID